MTTFIKQIPELSVEGFDRAARQAVRSLGSPKEWKVQVVKQIKKLQVQHTNVGDWLDTDPDVVDDVLQKPVDKVYARNWRQGYRGALAILLASLPSIIQECQALSPLLEDGIFLSLGLLIQELEKVFVKILALPVVRSAITTAPPSASTTPLHDQALPAVRPVPIIAPLTAPTITPPPAPAIPLNQSELDRLAAIHTSAPCLAARNIDFLRLMATVATRSPTNKIRKFPLAPSIKDAIPTARSDLCPEGMYAWYRMENALFDAPDLATGYEICNAMYVGSSGKKTRSEALSLAIWGFWWYRWAVESRKPDPEFDPAVWQQIKAIETKKQSLLPRNK